MGLIYQLEENKVAARLGGNIAGNARRSLEHETRKPVVSSSNFLPKKPRFGGG
jgi:hypothetical protein